MPLLNTLDLSIPKIITTSSPPPWIYRGRSFDTIIDPSTRNNTIKLFLPFKLIKRLDIDIQVLL
jgi:hypothetical protein